MSQRDVLAELRTAHVEAPPALRARVRLTAAQAPTPRRTRRRFALVLVPVVVAAVAASVYFSTRSTAPHQTVLHGAAFSARSVGSGSAGSIATPAPSAKRAQRYGATLDIRVKNVTDAVARAQRIAASLGGFTSSVHLSTAKRSGHADLVLRVPRSHVQRAVARLRVLGAVVGEEVDIQDLQAGINTTDRTIARLQRQLKALRAQTQTDTVKRQIASLTSRVEALQRQRATTVHAAHYATVRLSLSTPPVTPKKHHHYLRDVAPWLGGAAALLVLLIALRGVLRLREARLLSRS
jgi:hypothetical protein